MHLITHLQLIMTCIVPTSIDCFNLKSTCIFMVQNIFFTKHVQIPLPKQEGVKVHQNFIKRRMFKNNK
jgi:hypothetical protein